MTGKTIVIAAVVLCTLAAVSTWGKWVAVDYWGGPEGSGDGQFRLADSIAVSPLTGYVYVSDYKADRIQYFSRSGSNLGMWSDRYSPSGLSVASNGHVYVVESSIYQIRYFTPTGSLLGDFGLGGEGPGRFEHVFDVALNAGRTRVYALDSRPRVRRTEPSGAAALITKI